MSFQQRWQEANEGKRGGGEEWNVFKKAFPNLAEAVLGVPYTKDDPGRPACKILIFAEADRLKFMLSPVTGDLVAFGTFPDSTGGFEALDQELAKGAFEWKKRRR